MGFFDRSKPVVIPSHTLAHELEDDAVETPTLPALAHDIKDEAPAEKADYYSEDELKVQDAQDAESLSEKERESIHGDKIVTSGSLFLAFLVYVEDGLT